MRKSTLLAKLLTGLLKPLALLAELQKVLTLPAALSEGLGYAFWKGKPFSALLPLLAGGEGLKRRLVILLMNAICRGVPSPFVICIPFCSMVQQPTGCRQPPVLMAAPNQMGFINTLSKTFAFCFRWAWKPLKTCLKLLETA